ncbi:diacylglycerol/lipid kinase family protein [Georgenia yuyongxinii]|uniref:diacylglycerol/lipid kinase family protein n=1 Tax=Georgenia yuyongxinii TaxID=2589797 RepID=UPI00143D2D7A|nr:diacylglycerol kinase family protein [Georgenia yuyongxinii]
MLFINPTSGGGKAARADLAGRARALGIEIFTFGPETSLDELVADAVRAGADGLGVAGGDGSLAVVATAAVSHGLAFVCIPAGTRNHFALDLGVDRRDLVGALEAFTEGVERRIDVGQVDERLFLNNVSLGIYGDAIQRSEYRDAKVRTLAETVRAVLGPSGAAPAVQVVDDRGREHARPAVVLVSNNPYALNRPLVTGTRPTLAGGQLGIVILDLPDGPRHQAGRAWTASSVVIDAPEPVHLGIDGEAVTLQPPLKLLIRPAVLRVRISSRHPGVSPSGLLKP